MKRLILVALLASGVCHAQLFEAEPNNTNAQANAVPSGALITGQLLSGTDIDTFSINAPAAGSLTVALTRENASNGSYVISVTNATGTVLASFSTAFTGNHSQAVGVAAAGVHYVQVRGSSTVFTSAQYGLAVTFAPQGPPQIAASPRLVNMSLLLSVPAGETITAGFVLAGGTLTRRVLVRAVGPALSSFGVASPMADPRMTLFNSAGVVIGGNDNWSAFDQAAMASVGAFALPSGSRDAAFVATLAPGNYTVQVGNAVNAAGSVLVEAYEVP